MNLFQLDGLINEESISVSDFASPFRVWMDASKLLKTKGFQREHVSDGSFDSDKWIIFNELNQNHNILEFESFEKLFFKKCILKEDIVVIKCWLTSKLQEDYDVTSVSNRLRCIRLFILETNNFSEEMIKSNKGDIIFTLIKKHELNGRHCYYLKEYLDFLDSVGLIREEHLQVLSSLSDISNFQVDAPRRLPSNKDVMAFEYYIKRFFSEEKDSLIANYYKPLLLWWKITTVVPMRASEFAFKLKRDCLVDSNGEYYLKIDRIKVKNNRKNVGRIPILNKVGITKEVYDLISEYIELTSFDTTSRTLISYEALVKFRRDYSSLDIKKYNLRHQPENKGDRTSNTSSVLTSLLNSFYVVVIKGFYRDSQGLEQLTLGDTRHLAFSSLVLQGLNPIEIAMLGGHTTLSTQDSYTGHVNYYVDSEILNFVSNRNIPKEISDKNLINIVFSKPIACPRILADCHKTEDNIGYCTLDISKDIEFCDGVSNCVYCKKWWCEPTNENYLKVKHYLETAEIEPLKTTIKEEEKFLFKLLEKAKTINIEGLLELDKEYEEQISTARLRLKSSADKMIGLKKSLLEYGSKTNLIGGE